MSQKSVRWSYNEGDKYDCYSYTKIDSNDSILVSYKNNVRQINFSMRGIEDVYNLVDGSSSVNGIVELKNRVISSLCYLNARPKLVLLSANDLCEVKVWNLYTRSGASTYCFPKLKSSSCPISKMEVVKRLQPTKIVHNGSGVVRFLDLDKLVVSSVLSGETELRNFVVDEEKNAMYVTTEKRGVHIYDLNQMKKVGKLDYPKDISGALIVLREGFAQKEVVCAKEDRLWYYDLKSPKKNEFLKHHKTGGNSALEMIDVPDRNSVCIADARSSFGWKFVNIYNGKTVKEHNVRGRYQNLVYFPGHNPHCYVDREVIQSDFHEKVDFLLGFVDLKIQLDTVNLYLWKVFFNIEDNCEKKDRFSRTKLDVDERSILFVLLGEQKLINFRKLVDLFMFFKMMGMKEEMYFIVNNPIFDELKKETCVTLYEALKYLINVYENEKIRSLFQDIVMDKEDDNSGEPDEKGDNGFKHSLTVRIVEWLSQWMKKKEEDVKKEIEYVDQSFDKTMPRVIEELGKFMIVSGIRNHADFEGVETNRDTKSGKNRQLFQRYYEMRNKTGNLKLKSRLDQKNRLLNVHKEILILSSTFFLRIFRFSGIEVDDVKKSGVLTIESLTFEEVEYLIEYLYLGSMTKKTPNDDLNIEFCSILVKLMVFSNMFLEYDLFNYCLDQFSRGCLYWDKTTLELFLKNCCLVLKEHDIVGKNVIGCLAKMFKEKEMNDIIDRSVRSVQWWENEYRRREEEEKERKRIEEEEKQRMRIEEEERQRKKRANEYRRREEEERQRMKRANEYYRRWKEEERQRKRRANEYRRREEEERQRMKRANEYRRREEEEEEERRIWEEVTLEYITAQENKKKEEEKKKKTRNSTPRKMEHQAVQCGNQDDNDGEFYLVSTKTMMVCGVVKWYGKESQFLLQKVGKKKKGSKSE